MGDPLEELQRAVIRFRDERDWKQFHRLKDLVLGLQIEAAELAELFLWKTRDECLDALADRKTRDRVAEEMADVTIFLLYLAEETGISLEQAVQDKLALNSKKYPVAQAKGSARKWTALEAAAASEKKERGPGTARETPISRVLAIDWSGDKSRSGERRKIWTCEVVDGQVAALTNGRSRGEVCAYLIEEARRDPGFVVGFDFAFSFPGWFLEEQGFDTVEALWEAALTTGERWLEECPFPFWGRHGKKKGPIKESLYRVTDHASTTASEPVPNTLFMLAGPRQVGTASIRGMPVLARLHAAGFAIWPFHQASLPLVVEIWPRLFMGDVKKTDPEARRRYLRNRWPDLPGDIRAAAEGSDDAFDALASGLAMDRFRADLGGLEPATDPISLLEGKIWRPPPDRFGSAGTTGGASV